MTLRQKLEEFISLDYRSLALMRFGMGLLILLDLFERARYLTAFYTDSGTLSRATLLGLDGNKFLVSLHMMSGSGLFEALLFIAAAVFAVMLMLGYRTRLATIVSWILLISLQSRNPLVLQGADIAFRVVLFWMLFLPTGRRWSLDRLFGRTARAAKKTVASPATLAYIVQIVLIYLFSGLLKTGAAWHDGTAVYYALSIDQLVRPLGEHLRTWRAATHFLTYATRDLELFGSLLYFSPWSTGLVRTIGIMLFALMQVGFNLSLHLGLFGAISIVITLGLLPPYFWDSWILPLAARIRRKAATGLSLYYDADCGFCFKTVHILKNFFLLSAETKLAKASDDAAMEAIMQHKNSWVVVDETGTHTGFEGFIAIVAHSPVFFWLAPVLRLYDIERFGEWCYRKVAAQRLTVCLPELVEKKNDSKPARVLRFAGNAIIVFLTVYIVLWNMDTPAVDRLLAPFDWIAWTTRLDQRFDMFAPTPLTEDGWYVIPAALQDGQTVDIFKDGPTVHGATLYPVSYQKPADVANTYPDQRWQKYLMNLAESDNSQYRLAYGQYLCRTWNAKHAGGETLETFKILFMIENTPTEGQPNPAPVVTTLWDHHCF